MDLKKQGHPPPLPPPHRLQNTEQEVPCSLLYPISAYSSGPLHPHCLLSFTMITITQQCVLGFYAWIFMSVNLDTACAVAIKDRCLVMLPEIPDFHSQGEAVVIRFPFLENAIIYRRLQVDNSTIFHISHSNHGDLRNQSNRVVQRERSLWLLPSLPSDSGTYTYVFRSSTFCFTGKISVIIYASGKEDMDMMSHPVSTQPDRDLTINCPHIGHFKKAESPQWYKGFHSEAFPLNSTRYNTQTNNLLTISNISVEDEGLYTCRLRVTVNNTQYNVSRTWKLQVSEPVPVIPVLLPQPTTTSSDTAFPSSSVLHPYISSPVNGSVIQSHLGSMLVIECRVFAGIQSPDSAKVGWLVSGQPPERSDLSGRVFQSRGRITAGHVQVQLVFLEVYEEDTKVDLRCVAEDESGRQEAVTHITLQDSTLVWLVTASVSGSFFLMVLSVFLHLLCAKSQKQRDYTLARQSSTY
ncbi:interleukin-1 receptor type 2 [Astyanax mexicanus]|uniref:Interleukin-1 receptor type 2 n=1 Tax=Astyanax mexicanus TaxID=7994 RepID=W5KTT7_ASTMX|nr:interleukin-1 receptor type 2 [Astyanax mexicanus]